MKPTDDKDIVRNKRSGKPRAHLIANARSGTGKGSELLAQAPALCEEAGYELVHYEINSPSDFERQSQAAVEAAVQDGGVVIAAGGDGTIRGVAQAAAGTGVRFGAVPCGTFNFFARTHGIPEDPAEAFRIALTGEEYPARLGSLNGHIFLINASLGLYAKAIREREANTRRFGRNRIVVIFSTIFSLLSDHLLLKVDLVSEGQSRSIRTPMIFMGNSGLQLRNLALNVAQCAKLNMLGVILMKPVTRLEALRVILRGIFRTIENEERLVTFCTDDVTIHTRRRKQEIALDGEILQTTSPLRVKAMPGALKLMRPRPESQAQPESDTTEPAVT